jgi:hypothetical protein
MSNKKNPKNTEMANYVKQGVGTYFKNETNVPVFVRNENNFFHGDEGYCVKKSSTGFEAVGKYGYSVNKTTKITGNILPLNESDKEYLKEKNIPYK